MAIAFARVGDYKNLRAPIENMEKEKEQMMEQDKVNIVDSVETLLSAIDDLKSAQNAYSHYSQEQVDAIFKACALAANNARIPLAKLAVEETGMGIVEDKVIKNHYASEYIYNAYREVKTCGVLEENQSAGTKKIAEPLGIIAAVIPTTNPTSTAIFKILLALKTRNGIIISPHPKAKKSTIAVAKLMLDAALKAVKRPDITDGQIVLTHQLCNRSAVSGVHAGGGKPGIAFRQPAGLLFIQIP